MNQTLVNIPNQESTSEAWINWHENLKNSLGRKNANTLWIKAWESRGRPSQANTVALRNHMESNGVTLSDRGITGWIADFGDDIGGYFGDMFSVGKYVGISLAVIIVGGIGLAVYKIASNPIESAKTVIKAKAMSKGK